MEYEFLFLLMKPKIYSDEPGIPELELLYYGEYNYNNGRRNMFGMTDKDKKVYNADLEKFYKLSVLLGTVFVKMTLH